MSNLIAEAIAQGDQKLIFTLPPRHGKSTLISQWVPVWFLNLWPNQHILLASYGSELAIKFGRSVRNTIMEHNSELDVQISGDSTSVSRFHTTKSGSMVSLGAGGSITGRGANLLLCDDLIKNWADSQSETLRKSLRDWFLTTLLTRLEPGGTCILTQTRWNSEDLVGYLIREHGGQWKEIRIPALAEPNDCLGRAEGDALCPQRYGIEKLLEIKEQMGSYMFESLYQQRPSAPRAGMFKRDSWKFFQPEEKPNFQSFIQSWDAGYQKSENASYSVCITIGIAPNGYYILDVFRERLEFPNLVRAVDNLYRRFIPELILVEAGGAGISLAQNIYNETRLPIRAIKVKNKSKTQRAWEVTTIIENGRVFLPAKAVWLDDFLDEMTAFPHSRFTDQADALSQSLDFLRKYSPKIGGNRPSVTKRPSSGRPPLYGDRKLRGPREPGLFNSGVWIRTTILP